MGIKDLMNRAISYFDMEDVSDIEGDNPQDRPTAQVQTGPEERVVAKAPAPIQEPVSPQRAQAPRPDRRPQPAPARYERPKAPTQRPVHRDLEARQVAQHRPQAPLVPRVEASVASPSSAQAQSSSSQAQPVAPVGGAPAAPVTQAPAGQTKIVLRYPRQYEDAPAIVDLLVAQHCVLVDFEQMQEAPARRCLDFIDGASKVLHGSLRRVNGTIYLLAPQHVQVDMEDIRQASQTPDTSFDYDMKRR